MKYFVYSYNYLTLFKAISYARNVWGVDNTYIIFTAFVSNPPTGFIESDFNKIILKKKDQKKLPFFNYAKTLYMEKQIVKTFMNYINQEQPDKLEKIFLVVFRDNFIRETILIKEIKKQHHNIEVVLIEEGLGLYASPITVKRDIQFYLRVFIHKAMGIPSGYLTRFPQGTNPEINYIYCSRPEILKNKYPERGNIINKEIELYTEDNCKYFVNDVLELDVFQRKYQYVFLSQPLFPVADASKNEKYNNFLMSIFNIAIKHGYLLIKPHPKDKWDYSQYTSSRIWVSDPRTSNCPFECLIGYYGNPQTITLFSSAGCNVKTNKPNIFLYDMFPDMVQSDIFSEEFIIENNIKRCSTLQEYEKALVEE